MDRDVPSLAGLERALVPWPAHDAQRRGDAVLCGVVSDSREVRPGHLFVAVPGRDADGHDHAANAVRAGAAALLVQRWLDLPVPQVRVRRVRATLGTATAYVLGDPGRRLRLSAVTGTNGKTTTTLLLRSALQAGGRASGAVGTLGACTGTSTGSSTGTGPVADGMPPVSLSPGLTTPEAPHLQALLARMAGAGLSDAVVETSSIAVDQGRVDGLHFAVAVHLGLEEEHLDYHGTLEHYAASKAALFEPDRSAAGVVRVDDPWGRRLARQAGVPVTTFGSGADADVRIVEVHSGLAGTEVRIDGADGPAHLCVPLLGRVNAVNAVAAYLAARRLGVPRAQAAAGLRAVDPPRGRHAVVTAPGRPLVLVDYAHTPLALTALVRTARDLAAAGGRVLVVFGGRGERERSKRPLLARAMGQADRVVLTTHSTSREDMRAILHEYQLGLLTSDVPVDVVLDRREAIARALSLSRAGDVVVVAGRGHETTMRVDGRDRQFDDAVVAAQLLEDGVVRLPVDDPAPAGPCR